jgi:hypothetical protein
MGAKKKIEKSDSTIRVEILDTKPNGFYLQDSSLDLANLKTGDIDFRLNITTSTHKKNKLIKIILELNAFLKERENDDQGIFGINSETVFRTPDFKNIMDDKGENIVSKKFAIKLMNICIGGIRGMLSSNLVNTDLNQITLPLFDLGSIDSFK